MTGTQSSTIGAINPFRYRGYYWDEESWLYYLKNRYYDAVTGRFLNADHPAIFIVSQGSLLQYNMYTYCFSNPINNYDPNGLWTLGISLGANINLLLGVSISCGIFMDDNFNIEVQWSYAVPGIDDTMSIGFADAGVGISFQVTDRDTVYDLYGPASYVGASGGSGRYIGGDIISFTPIAETGGDINGIQLMAGMGAGLDVHLVETNTKPLKTLNSSANKLIKKPSNSLKLLKPSANKKNSSSKVIVNSGGMKRTLF